MYCQYCGKEIHAEARVCMSCGCAVPVSEPVSEPMSDGREVSRKKGVVALVLVLLLGGLGVHRFYVGRIGSAVVMLLLHLTGFGIFIRSYIDRVWWAVERGDYDAQELFSTMDFTGIGVGYGLMLGVGIWCLVDLIMICVSRFRDKQGRIVKL